MGCRCNERRQHILVATRAAVRGDLKTISGSMRNIAKTVRDDANDIRFKVSAARASLARR